MFKIFEGNSQNSADVEDFINLINQPTADLCDFFNDESEIFIARAPGRLDVMGGIADYSGSLVLEMPIAEATLAALQKTSAKTLKIISISESENLIFEMNLADFIENNAAVSYEKAKSYFSQNAENHWVSYIAGVFLVLMREKNFNFKDFTVHAFTISSGMPLATPLYFLQKVKKFWHRDGYLVSKPCNDLKKG